RLSAVPVGCAAGQLFDGNLRIGERFDRILRAEQGILVPGFALEHGILQDAVPVPVDRGGILLPGVQYQAALQGAVAQCIDADVIDWAAAADMLIHRLSVEEDKRDPGLLRFIDDSGSCGPFYNVDAEDIAAACDKTVDLFELSGLVAAPVDYG